MTPQELDRELRTILAWLELTSSAPAQALNPGGGKNDEGTGAPAGTAKTPADHYHHRLTSVNQGLQRRLDAAEATGDTTQRKAEIRKAHTFAHKQREQILHDAQREWQHLTGRDGKAPHAHTADLDTERGITAAIRADAPGKPADTIAATLGLSVFLVRRIYLSEGLDPHDGSRPTIAGPAADRARRAREMADCGMTERQIMLALGVAKSTVRRDLGRAA